MKIHDAMRSLLAPGEPGHLIRRQRLTQYQAQPAGTSVPAFTPLLSDAELADILIVTVEWVRSHADEIPGLERLGMYYRFRRNATGLHRDQ